jgi:hypothetical protein
MDEVRVALDAGQTVTTHTDPVSVPGWNGAGYVILDPETGDGEWKAGGGKNGACLLFLGALLLVISMFILMNPAGIAVAPFLLAPSVVSRISSIAAGLLISFNSDSPFDLKIGSVVRIFSLALLLPFLVEAASFGAMVGVIMSIITLVTSDTREGS